MYFLSPNSDSLYLENINYIFTVWDLCHRDHPEFPEVRNNLAFEKEKSYLTKYCHLQQKKYVSHLLVSSN